VVEPSDGTGSSAEREYIRGADCYSSSMRIDIPEIDEKYEVLRLLGEGGMGAVYEAKHRLLDERRVIKTIRPQLRDDPDLQERFLREARVAAKMDRLIGTSARPAGKEATA